MKFTKGYWLNLPGVTNTDAVQVREVKVENDRVYLYTVPYHADMRAMGGPLLEMYISSPQPDIIRTEAYHFMGSNQKMPAFELNDAHCALEVENTETTVTIKSGNTKLVIGKNPCSFDYYYKDKKLTSIGNRFGNAMISTISTPDGNYMRAQMNLDIGEKVYGLGERFTPYVKNGQTVEIDAPQNCAENRYVGRMTVDGKVTGKTFLEYGELLGGAKIAFGMQPEPDKDRGAKPGDAPYSMSREDCR